MTNLNETEKKDSIAQNSLRLIKGYLDLAMDIPERAGKWNKTTATAALGGGIGLLGGVYIATNSPWPSELWKYSVVVASGLAGAGGAVLIVIERDERRKGIQEQQRFKRLRESQAYTLEILNKYPNLAPSLLPKLNYDLQTESILLREDAIGAIKVLPWNNDLPSNPEQNTLPPAQDNENPA